ncbi:MAG: DUF2264 domain-containing protein [Enhygromyxa sp.]
MRERSALLARLLGVGLLVIACGERAPAPERELSDGPARHIELAPPEDRERSPYTGWTRAHYEAVFARTLLGFIEHRSFFGARTRYPGGKRLPAAMEGATRMLPALGAWLACPCNPDRIIVEGRELDVTAIARAIVVSGTDPKSPDYWHPSTGGWDQREVEAASVAEFLLRSRARVWDRLSRAEQARIMAWLGPAETPLAANWLAFQIARNAALEALDQAVPEAALREQLDRLEADYVGDGFYRDGHQHQFDWYNAFVVHAELSFWRSLARDEAERVDRVARRTQAFLGHLPYLFDARGRVAPIGRSLGYRSAVLASLHASLLAGDDFIDPGLARRISAGNLGFHVEAGMFDAQQVLTRGYHGEQPDVLEHYLRPGSQYFATRGLSVLALPPDHPFWTAQEQPLPADLGDFVHAIPSLGWTLTHDADGAGLILHNARSTALRAGYYDAYARLDYAAPTWYARSGEGSRPYDSLIVSASAGRFDRRRSVPRGWAVAPGFAWIRYAMAPEAEGKKPHLFSVATLGDPEWVGPASLRLSCVVPSRVEPARAYQGSHAIALGPAPRSRGGEHAQHEGEERGPWLYLDSGEARPDWGAGAVLLAGLHGWERAGRELDHPAAAEHVLGGAAGYVGLGVDAPLTAMGCFASMQVLAEQPFSPEPLLAAAPAVSFAGNRATIEDWAGTQAWVELGIEPIERTVELGGVRATGRLRLLWVGEHEQGTRVVAVGLRELADEQGVMLVADEPRAIVACDFGEDRVRCELDGPARVRRPHAGALELRTRASTWTGADPRWRSREVIAAEGPELVAVLIELGEVGSAVIELE